jgi:hypothetical protein
VVEVLQVGLESVNFTLVDVHPGHEAAFNEWYERDHFYAGGVLGPSVLAGRRWYAPKGLRAVRFAGDPCPFADPSAGTNLATYIFNTPTGGEDFRQWVVPQLAELRRQGRMFAERTPVTIGFHTFDRVIDGPGTLDLPPHAVLDHPFGGLVATFACSSPSTEPDPVVPDLPAGSLTLSCTWRSEVPLVAQPDLSPFVPVTLLLTFLAGPPPDNRAATAALAGAVSALSGTKAMWAGGFLPVVRGQADFVNSPH